MGDRGRGARSSVYVAAPYGMRELAKGLAAALEGAGYRVTAEWLSPEYDSLDDRTRSAETLIAWAKRDAEGVAAADALVLVALGDLSRGGAHTELGLALGQGKPVFLYGEPTGNLFHWHPLVTHCGEDVSALLWAMSLLRPGRG